MGGGEPLLRDVLGIGERSYSNPIECKLNILVPGDDGVGDHVLGRAFASSTAVYLP